MACSCSCPPDCDGSRIFLCWADLLFGGFLWSSGSLVAGTLLGIWRLVRVGAAFAHYFLAVPQVSLWPALLAKKPAGASRERPWLVRVARRPMCGRRGVASRGPGS